MLISLVACELKAAENDYQLVNSILMETHVYGTSWEFTFLGVTGVFLLKDIL